MSGRLATVARFCREPLRRLKRRGARESFAFASGDAVQAYDLAGASERPLGTKHPAESGALQSIASREHEPRTAQPRAGMEPAVRTPQLGRRYRDVISHFASGVAVITAQSPDGPRGMTANALCSLSLDPVLLLVCFDRSARTWPVAQASGRFAVNILAEEQHEVSDVFASKRDEVEKWARVGYQLHEGVPILDGVIAWLVCELRATHPGGDHIIGIGEVLTMASMDQAHPLVWFCGKYGVLHRERLAEADLPD